MPYRGADLVRTTVEEYFGFLVSNDMFSATAIFNDFVILLHDIETARNAMRTQATVDIRSFFELCKGSQVSPVLLRLRDRSTSIYLSRNVVSVLRKMIILVSPYAGALAMMNVACSIVGPDCISYFC